MKFLIYNESDNKKLANLFNMEFIEKQPLINDSTDTK